MTHILNNEIDAYLVYLFLNHHFVVFMEILTLFFLSWTLLGEVLFYKSLQILWGRNRHIHRQTLIHRDTCTHPPSAHSASPLYLLLLWALADSLEQQEHRTCRKVEDEPVGWHEALCLCLWVTATLSVQHGCTEKELDLKWFLWMPLIWFFSHYS